MYVYVCMCVCVVCVLFILYNISTHAKQIVSMDTIATHFNLPLYLCVKKVDKLIEKQQLMACVNAKGQVCCLHAESISACVKYLHAQGRVDRNTLCTELYETISVH